VRRQCALLNLARSGVYQARKPANDNDAAVLHRVDQLFTAWPFLGSRRMTAMLRAEGLCVAEFLPARTIASSRPRFSALCFTTYFLTAISFLATNHLHRCPRGDRDSENRHTFKDAGD